MRTGQQRNTERVGNTIGDQGPRKPETVFDPSTIRKTYQVWAPIYHWFTPLYLLGNEARLRREAVDALRLEPGQKVLDMGCGTGRNFPVIMKRIGREGALVGVDYTPAMLQQAQKLVERNQWRNVRLVQGDAAQVELAERYDAVLATLAISVIPDYRNALENMVQHLSTGGRIAIADAKRSQRWYARPFNWVSLLLGWGAAANLARQPWQVLRTLVDDFFYTDWFMGFFYVSGGTVHRD